MVCLEDWLHSFDPLGNVVKASLKLFGLLIVHCAFEGLGHHQHAACGALGKTGCPKLLHAASELLELCSAGFRLAALHPY